MAANRTPAPRTLSPEIPVVSYPTPNVEDLLVVQDVDTRVPGYVALEYGDPHPDSTNFPGLKLVFQSPLDQESNYMWVRRIYAKDRIDEDAYNYAIKYSASDPAYPIYIRTYTILRSEYVPLPAGSPDPVFPATTLISEEVSRFKGDAEDGSLDSLYLKVVRVFEKLPGPTITRYESNEVGQKVAVTSQRKFYGDGYVSPNPDALTSFTSEIGEGNVITDTVKTLPEVFGEKVFLKEVPDPVPTKFRVSVPAVTEEETVTGAAAEPALFTGELSKSETQQTKFTKRKRRTSRPRTGLPKTLTQKATTEVKQLATITETLQVGDTSDTPTATKDVESESLGDGTYVVRKTTVPEVFPAKTFSIEAPDPAPQKFRVAAPSTTTEETVTGDATQPTLSAGEFAKSETQQTKFTKRTRKTSRPTAGLPKTLTQKTTTAVKQLATLTETLQIGDTSLTPSATTNIESEALGDGTYVVRKTTVPKVFDSKEEEKTLPDVIPPRFTAKIPTVTVTKTEEGTDTNINLFKDDLRVQKEKVSEFEVRTSSVSRDTSSIPSLGGKELEDTYNIQIPYTETISNSSDHVGSSEVEPLSVDQYLVRTYNPADLDAVLSEYSVEYPTRISLDLPRVLTNVDVAWAKSESFSDFKNDNNLEGTFRELSQSDTGSLTLSATLTPEVSLEFRDVWSSNIAATNHIFFIKRPVTTGAILSKLNCQQWPIFKPAGTVFTVTSKTLTKKIQAALSRGQSVANNKQGIQRSATDIISQEEESRPIVITVPPCISRGFTVSSSAPSTNLNKAFTLAYQALQGTGGWFDIPEVRIDRALSLNLQNSVSAAIPPSSPTGIPTSGRYLTDCRVEFFKYDWFIVNATVFNAAQLA